METRKVLSAQLLIKLFVLALTFSFQLSTFNCYSQSVGVSDAVGFNPQVLFHIYKSTAGGTLMQLANLTSTPNANRGLTFDVDGSFNLKINNRENASLSFYTNNQPMITILSNGNVGIGNTSPTALLDLGTAGTTAGALRIEGATSGYVTLQAPASVTSYALTLPGAVGATGQVLQLTGSGGSTQWTTAIGPTGPTGVTGVTGPTGLLASGTAAGNTTYWNGTTWVLNSSNIFNNGGNVGVGTITPAAKLDVYQTGGASGTATAQLLEAGNTSNYYGNNQIVFGYSGTGISYAHAIKTRHNSGAATGNAIDFYVWNYGTDLAGTVGSKQVMTLDGTGNVGIGTTTPTYRLHVVGTAGAVSYLTDGTNYSYLGGGYSGYGEYAYGSNYGGYFVGGTYGLGMNGKLDLYWCTGVRDWSGSLGTTGQVLANNGGYIYWTTLSANISGSGTANYVTKWTGTNTIGNSIMYDNGQVGIGTTSPGYPLDVVGYARASGEIIGTMASGSGQFRAVNGNYGTFLRNDGSDTYILLTASGSPYGSWNTLRPFRINDASGDVYIAAGGSSYDYFQHSTGYVGMGTTAPAFRLEVDGGVYCNGDWFRVAGNNGIYWQSWGPGIYAQDATWLRTYNNCSFWAGTGAIATNGGMSIGRNGTTYGAGTMNAIGAPSVGYGTGNFTNTSTTTGAGYNGVWGCSYNDATYFNDNVGVMGCGGNYGVMGYATPSSPALGGGYFAQSYSSYYGAIGYYSGYKIVGTGIVSTIKITEKKGRVTLHAPETPGTWFEDMGIAQMMNGKVTVDIDPVFLECVTIDAAHPYMVFVTPQGNVQNQVVVKRNATSFDIVETNGGTSTCEVAWRMLATWKNFEDVRFEEGIGPAAMPQDPDGISDLIRYYSGRNSGEIPDELYDRVYGRPVGTITQNMPPDKIKTGTETVRFNDLKGAELVKAVHDRIVSIGALGAYYTPVTKPGMKKLTELEINNLYPTKTGNIKKAEENSIPTKPVSPVINKGSGEKDTPSNPATINVKEQGINNIPTTKPNTIKVEDGSGFNH